MCRAVLSLLLFHSRLDFHLVSFACAAHLTDSWWGLDTIRVGGLADADVGRQVLAIANAGYRIVGK